MFTPFALWLASAWLVPTVSTVSHHPLPAGSSAGSSERAGISLWTDREVPYRRGDRVRVYLKTQADAYVTVLRIDTDGRVRILFPEEPWQDNFVRGGRSFEILGQGQGQAFNVDDYPGVGYVFAVASFDPFQYNELIRGDHWDYRAISDGRVRGDPYVWLTELAARIADDYDYDLISYDVERHYDYPRFLCYDCHSYANYSSWDPYDHFCSRFRIVIYDDPFYYPSRYYGGRRGAIVRPVRPRPRYVFKDYDGHSDYLTRITDRRREPEALRPNERNPTSADFGGPGSVPAPVVPRDRAPATRLEEPGNSLSPATPEATPRRREQDRPQPQASPTRDDRPRRKEGGGTHVPPAPRRPEPSETPPPPPPTAAPTRGGGEEKRPRAAPPEKEERREPRSAEPQTRQAPAPRGTGEPELRRRKPG